MIALMKEMDEEKGSPRIDIIRAMEHNLYNEGSLCYTEDIAEQLLLRLLKCTSEHNREV